MLEQLLSGTAAALLISVMSHRVRFLTLSGSVAQCVLGSVLLGLGGWRWTVPMVVFFLLSSLLSKLKNEKRHEIGSVCEKSSRRDAGQVLANGGMGGAMVCVNMLFPSPAWYIAYLGSVAAATADTWGTELGTLSHAPPRLITTFEQVVAGRSGAVSPLGMIAGLLGAVIISLSGLFWLPTITSGSLLAVVLGGVGGSLFDSVLGATAQAGFTCARCGKLTERALHCGEPAKLSSGLKWVKNDAVNVGCTLMGGNNCIPCHDFVKWMVVVPAVFQSELAFQDRVKHGFQIVMRFPPSFS